jgi:hypothetical protein
MTTFDDTEPQSNAGLVLVDISQLTLRFSTPRALLLPKFASLSRQVRLSIFTWSSVAEPSMSLQVKIRVPSVIISFVMQEY